MESENISRVAEFFNTHQVKAVRVVWCDMHGLARGKVVSREKFFDELKQGITFSIAPLFMNLRGEVVDPQGEASQTGWTSCFAVPDLSTFRLSPRDPHIAEVICCLQQGDGRPIPFLPREVLSRVKSRCEAMGYSALIGSELEFYLLDGEAATTFPPGKNCYRLIQGRQEHSFLTALQRMMEVAGMNFEASMSEDGPGQFEIVLYPTEALQQADEVFRARHLVKALAAEQGLTATFLSKPLSGESGSGYHIHQTLTTVPKGRCVFDASQFGAEADRHIECFVAGQLSHLPEVCAFLLPTVNAYKRVLTRGALPLSLTWGEDNRTVALRVVCRGSENARVENRVLAGEANPYLAIAASLAAGLQGIKDNAVPPPPVTDNAFERDTQAPPLPMDLGEALHQLAGSDFAREWLGEEVVRHFLCLKQDEWNRYRRAVTDWEKQEYLAFL